MRVSIEYQVETEDGKELSFSASADVSPIIPAVLNPVDRSHPEEGGEVENVELQLDGKPITMRDAVELGLNNKKLLEALSEAAADQDNWR